MGLVSGGDAASVRTLGPYTVSFNTPNIATDWVKLVDLPAGVWVTRIAVVVVSVWDAGGHFTLTVNAGTLQTVWTSAAVLESQGSVNAAPSMLTDLLAGANNLMVNGGAVAQAGGGLYATIDVAATTGSLKVYALASA